MLFVLCLFVLSLGWLMVQLLVFVPIDLFDWLSLPTWLMLVVLGAIVSWCFGD